MFAAEALSSMPILQRNSGALRGAEYSVVFRAGDVEKSDASSEESAAYPKSLDSMVMRCSVHARRVKAHLTTGGNDQVLMSFTPRRS